VGCIESKVDNIVANVISTGRRLMTKKNQGGPKGNLGQDDQKKAQKGRRKMKGLYSVKKPNERTQRIEIV
jgi:hypothetical protein